MSTTTGDDSAVASTSSVVVPEPIDCSGPCSGRRLMPEQDAYRRWLFSKDYLDTKIIKKMAKKIEVPTVSSDHALAEDELRWRQKACSFIQAMGELLNRPIKDGTARGRVSQNCLCAAMVHMHRFFVFHSFKRFNCQDIAAACLFLAAKSEECPRKLDHVVRVWHSLKAKEKGQSLNLEAKTEAYMNAMNYIVTLENTVLQTLAFDLQVELPHVHVVKACQRFLPGDKMMSETAYYFATDVLLLTNLCVREKSQVIACVCISLVSNWRNYEVPDPSKEQCWFQAVEPALTKGYLHALTLEVAKIYVENRNRLNLNLFSVRNYLAIGGMNVTGSSGTTPPRGSSVPEPPMKIAAPPAGQQVKAKIDLTRYYQRHSLPTSASSPSLAAAEQPSAEHVVAPAQPAPIRKSFIPDLNKIESEVHQELRRRQVEQNERRRLNVHPPLPAAKFAPFTSGSTAETAAAVADGKIAGHQQSRSTAETNAQILKRKADDSSRKRARNEADKSEQPTTSAAEQPASTKRMRTTAATAGELSDLPPPPPPPPLPADKRKPHHHHALHQYHKAHHYSEREKRREEERRMRRQPPVDVRKRTAEIGAKFGDGENEKQEKQTVDSPLAKTSSRTEAERCAVVPNSADHKAHSNRPPVGNTASASGDMRKLLNKLTGASFKLSPTADKQQQHRKAAVGDRSTPPPPPAENGLEKLLVQKDTLLKEESERKMEKLEKIRAAAAKAPEDLEEGEIDD